MLRGTSIKSFNIPVERPDSPDAFLFNHYSFLKRMQWKHTVWCLCWQTKTINCKERKFGSYKLMLEFLSANAFSPQSLTAVQCAHKRLVWNAPNAAKYCNQSMLKHIARWTKLRANALTQSHIKKTYNNNLLIINRIFMRLKVYLVCPNISIWAPALPVRVYTHSVWWPAYASLLARKCE